jgi:hypothetical protein
MVFSRGEMFVGEGRGQIKEGKQEMKGKERKGDKIRRKER